MLLFIYEGFVLMDIHVNDLVIEAGYEKVCLRDVPFRNIDQEFILVHEPEADAAAGQSGPPPGPAGDAAPEADQKGAVRRHRGSGGRQAVLLRERQPPARDDGEQIAAEKIFLNMTSRNGRENLISLLQYFRNSTLDNPDIPAVDDSLAELDGIVSEVKQSEEWEQVEMSFYNIAEKAGFESGQKAGFESGQKAGFESGQKAGFESGQKAGLRDGRVKGRAEGRAEGIRAMINDNLEEGISSERIEEKLMRHFALTQEEAAGYIKKAEQNNESGLLAGRGNTQAAR